MKLSKQKIIIIDGPMGAGKTTAADLLYKKLKHIAVLGFSRVKWFVPDFSRTRKERKMNFDLVLTMSECYCHHGFSVIIEQSFREKKIMDPYLNLAKRNHVPLFIYELYAPKKILLARIRRRPKPALAKRKTPFRQVLININSYPHKPYAKIRLSFDSSKLSPQRIVKQIIEDLKSAPYLV